MRHFSIELLKESPSPALRTCAKLAQLQVVHLCPFFSSLARVCILMIVFAAICWERVVCRWFCQLLGTAERG